ncbi:MAG TPA: alpha/beta fold hydrolase [Candidatus Hydrogenedentes bacterium]|nr:alpha/beta fold hydrolase [Candidatus Hydrogenedentota bacterium]HPX86840.1 alpha/beta fold hydrolase [Candidatus Hydrogenedentota bacterium]
MSLLMAVLAGVVLSCADSTPLYTDKSSLLYYLNEEGTSVPVSTVTDWTIRRRHIVKHMEAVMGSLPGDDRSRPPAFEVLEESLLSGSVRKLIRYESAPGSPVHAFLYLPEEPSEKRAAMLCLHPTSPLGKRVVAGEGERPNRNYAQELAAQGYVVLAPDYPGFGDDAGSRKTLYEAGYVSCTMKGIWNHIRAIDLLQSLHEVDPERIGCIGHSLGGHNTLFAGVFDERIKVLVTSCGFTAFPRYMGGDLRGWTHDGYMPCIAAVYENSPERVPFDFPEVLGALAPRPVFINAPVHDDNFDVTGVQECVASAKALYALFNCESDLVALYPEAEHDFPDTERQAAYAFIHKYLGEP